MPSAGFEPATPATKRPQTYALDRASTEVGFFTDKENECLQGKGNVSSTGHEKIPVRNSIYAHAPDFEVSNEFLLAILKAFVMQPLDRHKLLSVDVISSLNHL
jgi:hypothetical protein